MQLVHVVYGEGWHIEYRSEEQALRRFNLYTEQGTEAAYKVSLPAQYALVVEYYPGSTDIRRHKWAYHDEWAEGAPKAALVRKLRRADVAGNGTELRRKGQAAHVEYYAPARRRSTGSPAARPSQPRINPMTGKAAPMITPPCGGERQDYAYMG